MHGLTNLKVCKNIVKFSCQNFNRLIKLQVGRDKVQRPLILLPFFKINPPETGFSYLINAFIVVVTTKQVSEYSPVGLLVEWQRLLPVSVDYTSNLTS